MQTKKALSISIAIMFSVLYLSTVQACEQGSMYEFEHAITILTDVNSKNADTESYNYSVGNCVKSTNQKSDVEISSYVSKDETSMGSHKN